ncbi:MAG TPA: hypothetical protein VFM55_14415 [Micromonosporaceae bacterium]|nr:hypothetical protein [Micromonosporaceae bacterium]
MVEPDHPGFVVVPIPISDYAHHEPVPGIEEDVAEIVRLLGQLGGQELTWDVEPRDRTMAAVTRRLSDWARHPAPRSSVVVWLGHGETVAGDAWLATQETGNPIRYRGFKPENLVDAIASQWHRRGTGTDEWTIVVIEACGAGTFAQVLLKALPTDDAPDRLAVLPVGGAGASYAGQFRRALDTALQSYTINDKAIDVEDLVRRVANQLHAGRAITIGMHGLPPIRRRHLAGTTATVPLDTYAMLKAALGDLRVVTSVQGGELKELAWYFVGRRDDRARILRWLREQPNGMFVVTGPAGCGKSALLGNILVQTNRELRLLLDRRDSQPLLPADETHPEGVFDVVVHLTGLTADDVVDRIGRACGLGAADPTAESGRNVDRLVERLAGRATRFTVLADALDEAQEAFAIAASVLRQIAVLPQVRVLVGTRRSTRDDVDRPVAATDLLDALGSDATTEVRHLTHDRVAVVEYVRQRLTGAARSGQLDDPDPYAITEIAMCVADTRRPFLFAHFVVNELLAQPRLVTPAGRADLVRLLAADHRSMIAAAAVRLAAAVPHATPLLEALGTARGRGLPRAGGVWAAAARAFAGATDASPGEVEAELDRQIDVLLTAAAPYVMLDSQDGRSVYRLAHRTLRDYYLESSVPAGADDPVRQRHRLVAGALLDAAQREPAVRDSPYLARHLVEHVAHGNVWHDLAAAPRVLDRVDPNALAAAVLRRAFGEADLPAEVTGVAAARHTLCRIDPGRRAAVRMLATARYSGPDRGVRGPVTPCWRWGWAELRQDPLSVVVTGHRGVVTAAAPVPVPDGRVLLATGGSDRTVRLWDPTSGQPAGPPVSTPGGSVRGLAAARTAGRTVLACHCADGTVRLWDPVTGALAGQLGSTDRPVTALGVIELAPGAPAFVTVDRDGTLRWWHPDGTAAGALPRRGEATAVCAVPAADGPVLAVGGRDGSVELWDLADGRQLHSLVPSLVGRVTALCAGAAGGGQAVLTAVGNQSTVAHWTVGAGGSPVRRSTGHADWVNAAVTVSPPDGRRPVAAASNLVATAGNDATIRLWDAVTGAPVGTPLTGHSGSIRALATVHLPNGRTVVASGGDDRTVRLWAPALARPPGAGGDQVTSPVSAVAAVPGALVVGGAAGTVRLRAPAQAGGAGPTLRVPFPVTCVATTTGPDGSTLVAVGGDESNVWVWSPHAGPASTRPLAGHTDRVTALAALAGPTGRGLFVSGSSDTTVRVWDPATGRAVGAAFTRHGGAVTAVVADRTRDGTAVVASASRDREVRLWYPTGGQPASTLPAIRLPCRALALVRRRDGRLLLATGGDDGVVRLWDTTTAQLVGAPLVGHCQPVVAMTPLHRPDADPLLVTAATDATVLLWDPFTPALLDTLRLDLPARALTALGPRLFIGYDCGVVALDLSVGLPDPDRPR